MYNVNINYKKLAAVYVIDKEMDFVLEGYKDNTRTIKQVRGMFNHYTNNIEFKTFGIEKVYKGRPLEFNRCEIFVENRFGKFKVGDVKFIEPESFYSNTSKEINIYLHIQYSIFKDNIKYYSQRKVVQNAIVDAINQLFD